ncbi:MAG TPA: hypothetical protein PLS29_04260 [Acidimicrobiales bacterium]|nr:MAG: hypothetical protein B7Z69_05935 [Actinobacteria bacterium 21-73-9]HQU26227.1 hypothetical protein [Acidimicrobiales bacterium]
MARAIAALVVGLVILAPPAVAAADGHGGSTTTTTTTLPSPTGPYASCTALVAGAVPAGPRPNDTRGDGPTPAETLYECEVKIYRQAAAQIDAAFRQAVAQARAQFRHSIRAARSAAQRSAALQVMQAAIIQAATVRSAALVTLGPPPVGKRHA